MDMIASVMQLELPHWLIIAGFAFVLFGFVGILLRRHPDAYLQDPVAPTRADLSLQPPTHDAQ